MAAANLYSALYVCVQCTVLGIGETEEGNVYTYMHVYVRNCTLAESDACTLFLVLKAVR